MASPASSLVGMEASAISILTRAVELDQQRRFTEATVCYQEGLKLLMDVIKATTVEPKKSKLREKAFEYMDRAEKIKGHAEQSKEAGTYHEQICIESNSTGHSYTKIFGPFLDNTVLNALVEDPYIRSYHQIYNFLRFCELMVKSCNKLKCIKLVTSLDNQVNSPQKKGLTEIQASLTQHNVSLEISYSDTLHDRQIRFDNGWIFKIGRGLDYFKPTEGKFCIGYCDYDFRQCHETTVDIFYAKDAKDVRQNPLF